MGKWAARLAQETAASPHGGHCQNRQKGVLSVLAVTPKGGAREIEGERLAAVAAASEALDLAPVAWTDADMANFLERHARLIRWGWSEPDAEKQAEKLVMRDRETDDRVSCIDCRHYRPGHCGNHRHAGIGTTGLGRGLAELLQRCPGFDVLEGRQ